MRSSLLLGIVLAATLPSCAVNPHTEQHLDAIERLAGLRAYARSPGPPDPQRKIEVHDCTRPIGAITGNLYCG